MKHPLVPRVYVADVSLLWSLMWIVSYHPVPYRIRRIARYFCPFRVVSSSKKRLDAGRR